MNQDDNIPFRNPKQWCHYIIVVGYMIVGLILLAHVLWYFAARNILAHPPNEYLWNYIIWPTLGLLALVGLANVLVHSRHFPIFFKEWISLSLFTAISLYLCLSHGIARILMASFMLPIFASTIFANIKLSRLIFWGSIGSLFLIGGTLFLTSQLDNDMIMQIFVACFMCTCAYLLSKVMVKYGRANLIALTNYGIEHQRMREQIKKDTFTELYSRKTFDEYLAESIEECQERKVYLSLAMIDIDDFKTVNDRYGHAMGDRVLLYFSNVLKAMQADNIHAFRMGGDEFAILFNACDYDEARRICESLQAQLQAFPKRSMDEKSISFSCGIVSANQTNIDEKSFVKAADEALYAAKNNGKNQIFISRVDIDKRL